MSRQRYAEMARRWFVRVRPEASPRLPPDRRRLVGAVEQALRARSRRRAAIRLWGMGAALAAGAAAALVLTPRPAHLRSPAEVDPIARAPLLDRQEGPGDGPADAPRQLTVLGEGTALVAGNALRAPDAEALRIGSLEGTTLVLEPGGRLAVVETGATQRLALARGAVRVHVAKLRAGQRFIIETDDAEVEVHGTTFRVALAGVEPRCPDSSATRVTVTEGVVTVTGGDRVARLVPGQEWPGPCELAAGEPAARHPLLPSPASTSRRLRRGGASRAVPAERPPARDEDTEQPPTPSALAAQNDLFAAGVRAKRRGEPGEALRLFTAFLQRYPRSPLYEHALAQKMKLLSATDPWGSSEVASEYLARFPAGFARAEARALVSPAARP